MGEKGLLGGFTPLMLRAWLPPFIPPDSGAPPRLCSKVNFMICEREGDGTDRRGGNEENSFIFYF